MKIEIRLTQSSKASLEKFKTFGKNIRKVLTHELNTSGLILKKTTQQLMRNTPKTGRKYIINGKVHIASSGGNAPAILSGSLYKSLGYQTKGHYMDFGYKAKYGIYLELGTGKMTKRPALQTAMDKNIYTIQDKIGKGIDTIFNV